MKTTDIILLILIAITAFVAYRFYKKSTSGRTKPVATVNGQPVSTENAPLPTGSGPVISGGLPYTPVGSGGPTSGTIPVITAVSDFGTAELPADIAMPYTMS